jgi:antitoxin FitA
MAVNLSIKEVPEAVAERLRQRAERNHRSLQGELMAIVEQAANEGLAAPSWDSQRSVTSQGWKTIEDLMAERLLKPLNPRPGLPRGVDIIRADRDSR